MSERHCDEWGEGGVCRVMEEREDVVAMGIAVEEVVEEQGEQWRGKQESEKATGEKKVTRREREVESCRTTQWNDEIK